MSVIDIIKGEHRAVEKLFEEYRRTKEAGLTDKIVQELTTHMQLEEQLVYPRFDDVAPGLILHSIGEHNEAKEIIARINTAVANNQPYANLIAELEDGVGHHIHEEETKVFPYVEGNIDQEILDDLGKQWEQAKPQP